MEDEERSSEAEVLDSAKTRSLPIADMTDSSLSGTESAETTRRVRVSRLRRQSLRHRVPRRALLRASESFPGRAGFDPAHWTKT